MNRASRRRRGATPFAAVLLLVVLLAVPALPSGQPSGLPALEAPAAVPSLGSFGASPTYNETVAAPSLSPSEQFSFDLDGVRHTGTGGGEVRVPGLSAGLHTLTNLTAGPAPPGWEYFGSAQPASPLLLPEEPQVNLSFSLLDMRSLPNGTLHFHALHVPVGTVWQLNVNGTTTSSVTLWINVTSRNGTLPVQALSTVNDRGTARYRAPPADPAMNVSAGGVYDVNYTALFDVQVLASPGGFVLPNGSGWYAGGTNLTIRATGYDGYAFGTWTGTGLGSYSGEEPRHTLEVVGAMVETATFWPIGVNRQVIRVYELGVPSGVVWTVFVNGGGYSSATDALVVPNVFPCGTGSGGTYELVIPPAYANTTDPLLSTRYVPGPYPASVCGGAILNVSFLPQFGVSFRPSPGGTVSAANASGPVSSGSWLGNGSSVTFTATPSPGYLLAGWLSNGSASPSAPVSPLTVDVTGPVEEVAEFAPTTSTAVPTYSANFSETPALPAGTVWSLNLNGTSYASSTADLTISGLPAGTYRVVPAIVTTPDGLTEYQPVTSAFELTVPAAVVPALSYSTWYRVEVTPAVGGTASANVSWAPAGSTVQLVATPASGHLFSGWAGVGSGNYTGPMATVTVLVGGPLEESATFVTPTVPPHNWNVLVVASAAGVVVGLLVALWVPRRSRPTSAPSPSPPPSSTPPPEEHGPA